MEESLNPNENPHSSKIVDEELEDVKKLTHKNIEQGEFLLKENLDLLARYIEMLKGSENWVKTMIDYSKQNEEWDAFCKEHGQESSFSDRSYTVGDVEKELQNIEDIKLKIQEIHTLIIDDQLDIIKEKADLDRLAELEKEFKEIMTRIDPEQLN